MDGLKVVVHPLQVVLSLLDGLLHLSLARSQRVFILVAELNQLKSSKYQLENPLNQFFLCHPHLIDVKPGVSVRQDILDEPRNREGAPGVAGIMI